MQNSHKLIAGLVVVLILVASGAHFALQPTVTPAPKPSNTTTSTPAPQALINQSESQPVTTSQPPVGETITSSAASAPIERSRVVVLETIPATMTTTTTSTPPPPPVIVDLSGSPPAPPVSVVLAISPTPPVHNVDSSSSPPPPPPPPPVGFGAPLLDPSAPISTSAPATTSEIITSSITITTPSGLPEARAYSDPTMTSTTFGADASLELDKTLRGPAVKECKLDWDCIQAQAKHASAQEPRVGQV